MVWGDIGYTIGSESGSYDGAKGYPCSQNDVSKRELMHQSARPIVHFRRNVAVQAPSELQHFDGNGQWVVFQRLLTDGNRFNSCQVIYSQFGLAIHQNDHQARRRFVEWAQNEIAVVPDFHKRILFSDEAHFWLNGFVNKQNCRIWSEANPQVYVETPLHPEKLTVWCALWAGGILLQKR
ncbi:hypothetical protein TNCV_859931 [Trichonephila clavipes]|nr:hypothetical protein TNCV_859931 [Trichonephila clavipes]